MAHDSADDARDVWQGQPSAPFVLSSLDVKQRIARLDRQARRKTIIGSVAAIAVIVYFVGWLFFLQSVFEGIGVLLTIVGVAYLLLQLYQYRARTRGAVMKAETASQLSLDFYRSQLEHHRDFHRGRLFWSRWAMLAPGLVVFFLAFARANPHLAASIYAELAVGVGALMIAIPLNRRLARLYQTRIDELNRAQRERS